MKMLENKWALVTGSSRGIGQQIAWGLAGRGCNIIVHGRERQNLDATLAGLKAYPVQTGSTRTRVPVRLRLARPR